ncbi:MAG: hypothetical protein K0S16_515 [Moraxellaceae bacterium]|nr:hypothetical protein [Moraxellaceae bacterium]
MDRKLTEFIALLRNNGLRTSPVEVADAVNAIALVGYDDRRRFHDSLSATLAKSRSDGLIFERCFESFFSFSADDTPPAPDPAALSLPEGLQFLFGQGQGGGQGSGLPVPGIPASTLGEQLLTDTDGQLSLTLARAVAATDLSRMQVMTQKGLFARRILMAMGLEELERELEALRGSDTARAGLRADLLRDALERLRGRVREEVDRYFQLARAQNRDDIVRSTDFTLLRESDEVRAVIRRMAKRLVTLHRRREKQAARGILDVRATLRRNLAHDGVLMEPRWRRIRKDRPRVMAVCDVSRSVSQYARFLLLFLYGLQEVIPRLRSFVFASTLHEVTDLFEGNDVETALDLTLERYGLGSTDYGRAFADLESLALADIDRRTTLVILGDARNNNGDARLELMRQFHDRARQVIWLNPEDRNRWGSGDSEMLRYATCCTHTYSCRTLQELERIVDRLLKSA